MGLFGSYLTCTSIITTAGQRGGGAALSINTHARAHIYVLENYRPAAPPHDPDCYIAPRLLPELAPAIEANSAVEDLMVSLGATNIQISVNNQGDTIADKTSENNEQAE